MNREDIRNLIGGYATGSLSEEERRKLFEAALDDQELFDALQDEQVLKALFDDPVSREAVRRAAVESLPPPRTRWFAYPWLWAAGASAVLAACLLVMILPSLRQERPMTMVNLDRRAAAPPPQLDRPVLEAAPRPDSKAPPAKIRAEKKRQPLGLSTAAPAAENKSEQVVAALPPPPAPAKQPQLQPPAPVQFAPRPPQPTYALRQPQAAGQTEAKDEKSAVNIAAEQPKLSADAMTGARPRVQFKASRAYTVAGAASYPQAVIYTIARRLQTGTYVDVPAATEFRPGETIRLTLFPLVSGPLSVWEWDPAGDTQTMIFPEAATNTVEVRARENYTVPLDIKVKAGERLRITVGPGSTDVAIRTTP